MIAWMRIVSRRHRQRDWPRTNATSILSLPTHPIASSSSRYPPLVPTTLLIGIASVNIPQQYNLLNSLNGVYLAMDDKRLYSTGACAQRLLGRNDDDCLWDQNVSLSCMEHIIYRPGQECQPVGT